MGEPSWPSSIHSPIVWDSFFEAQTAKTGLSAVSTADAPAVGMPKIPRCLRRYRLRVFVVNPRDAEEISLKAAPRTDSDEVHNLLQTWRQFFFRRIFGPRALSMAVYIVVAFLS